MIKSPRVFLYSQNSIWGKSYSSFPIKVTSEGGSGPANKVFNIRILPHHLLLSIRYKDSFPTPKTKVVLALIAAPYGASKPRPEGQSIL